MNTKLIASIGLGVIGVILLPTIAISENKTQTLCDELNTLRHESVGALFVHFQGNDSLETATALLRQTGPDGRLIPSVSARFDRASAALRADPIQAQRKMRITELEAFPRARKCPALQDAGLMWSED